MGGIGRGGEGAKYEMPTLMGKLKGRGHAERRGRGRVSVGGGKG